MIVDRLPFKNSISTKLFKIVFIIYFSITVILTGIQMVTEYSYVREEVFRELQLLATAIEPGLAKSLWEMDITQVQSTLRVLSKLPIITGIKVEDEDTNLLEARGMIFIPPEKQSPHSTNDHFEIALENEGADIYHYNFDIIYGQTTEKVGKVTLYSNRSVIFDRVEYGFVLILINALLKTFALWTIFLVVSRYVLGRPLQHLIEIIRQINLDNLEHLKVNIRRKGKDELKTFEETLNAMIQKLIHARKKIKEKTQELEEKNKKLKQVDRLKDEFLVNTSHELRTPLHGIIGIAESLRDHSDTKIPFIQSNLSMIISSGWRLTNLVNDILDFSKLKHQTLRLDRQSVDIRQAVEVNIRLSQSILADKPLTIVNQIPAEIPHVYADENRLQQILHNLIANAIKFSSEGEITINAQVQKDDIDISITNPGPPIPLDKQQTIFHSFEQVDGSLSRQYDGAGLGLAITKQLVELHDGSITVSSNNKEENTFTFSLPIVTKENGAIDTYKRLIAPPISIKSVSPCHSNIDYSEGLFKILVVDDDTTNLQVVMNYLESHNYVPICVPSGNEALEWIEANGKPDLILLDIMMPHLSGFEICKIVRQTYSIGDLPIIFLTASHRKADIETGFALGANDYLTKPFEKSELLARISAHLKVLMAKDQLFSLRDCANRIATFKEHDQVLEFALEKMMETQLASDAVMFKEGLPIKHLRAKNNFLNHYPDPILFINQGETDTSEVTILNALQTSNPLWSFYMNHDSIDLENSHFVFLKPNTTHRNLICLFRDKEREPFNELDKEYIQSMLDQIRTIEKNIRTMLSDSLVQALPEVQPKLSHITHISACSPYCKVFVENESNPKEIRISLSTLDLYFSDKSLLRVHRSHLVNPQKIVKIRKTLVRKRNYQYEVVIGGKRNFHPIRIGDHFVSKMMNAYPQLFEEFTE